jgi:hypothetical protein
MLVQFSLNSAEARWVLAAGFWQWPVVQAARRVIVCRSSTGAAIMVQRWPEFPWQSFAAGITAADRVAVLRQPAAEAVVEHGGWRQAAITSVADLGPDDLIVKSANTYDGRRAGVLLGHRQGFGTMGRIYSGLDAAGQATGCPARVVVPMLTEKLVPPCELQASSYPDSALGWASRFMVYEPDLIFDERKAMVVLAKCDSVRIVGRGAAYDGASVTTYHVEVAGDGIGKLHALIDQAKGARALPFATGEAAGSAQGAPWGGEAK